MIHLIVGLIKRHWIKMIQYFPKPYKSFQGNSVTVFCLIMQQSQISRLFNMPILQVLH